MPNVEKTKVAIIPCDSYDEEKVYEAVLRYLREKEYQNITYYGSRNKR